MIQRGEGMDIAIFGLGYVGAVSAACLAGRGIVSLASIERGQGGSDQRRQEPRRRTGARRHDRAGGRGRAVARDHRPRAAIRDSELALVCVGTPSRGNGDLDLTYVRRVCEEIAEALRPSRPSRRSSSAAPCCRERSATW